MAPRAGLQVRKEAGWQRKVSCHHHLHRNPAGRLIQSWPGASGQQQQRQPGDLRKLKQACAAVVSAVGEETPTARKRKPRERPRFSRRPIGGCSSWVGGLTRLAKKWNSWRSSSQSGKKRLSKSRTGGETWNSRSWRHRLSRKEAMAGQQLGSMGNNEASNHCLFQSLGIDKQMADGLPQCQFLLQQTGDLAQQVKAVLGEAQWRPQCSRASRLQAGTATPRAIQALATPVATGGREQATSISPMRTGKGLSGKKHKSTAEDLGMEGSQAAAFDNSMQPGGRNQHDIPQYTRGGAAGGGSGAENGGAGET